MGIAEVIALGTLVAMLSGGAWGAFSAVNSTLSDFKADISLIKWRTARIERELGIGGDGTK